MGVLLGRLYDYLRKIVRGRRGEKLYVAVITAVIGAIALFVFYLKLKYY